MNTSFTVVVDSQPYTGRVVQKIKSLTSHCENTIVGTIPANRQSNVSSLSRKDTIKPQVENMKNRTCLIQDI
jgi:hypothetical protein